MSKPISEQQRQHLLYKYAHVGCPACGYEDNCDRPGECADNGCCLDLQRSSDPIDPPPFPFTKADSQR